MKNNTQIILSNLVRRILGDSMCNKFQFEINKSERNFFSLKMIEKDKLLITGDNHNSLASGLGYYMKNYLHVLYDPLNIKGKVNVKKLVTLKDVIKKETTFPLRYALNYCSYGYTTAFWGWKEYEELLDYFALNGINLMLMLVGQEKIYRDTFVKLGLSKEIVGEWLPNPCYLPWFYMGNMYGFLGGMSDDWYNQQIDLGKKILNRMKELDIEPVFNGYNGMIPVAYKERKPEIQIIPEKKWENFSTPMLINMVESKEEFLKVANTFYKELQESYQILQPKYFSFDLFHEGAAPKNLNLEEVGIVVAKSLKDINEKSIWLLQGWQNNPSLDLIRSLDKKRLLILDLFAEQFPAWQDNEEFSNTPWIWNMLNNFGGKQGFNGDLYKITSQIKKVKSEANYLRGIGIAPEGLGNNPLLYDFFFTQIWDDVRPEDIKWISNYCQRRYRKSNAYLEEAIYKFIKNVYGRGYNEYQGAPENLLNARPKEKLTKIERVSAWGGSKFTYDSKALLEIISLMLAGGVDQTRGYQFDLTDLLRQAVSDLGREIFHSDIEDEKKKAIIQKLFKLEVNILKNTTYFCLEDWIASAKSVMTYANETDYSKILTGAYTLISTWSKYPQKEEDYLHDYSNRQWGELVEIFYQWRWELWWDTPVSERRIINWDELEKKWVQAKVTESLSDTENWKVEKTLFTQREAENFLNEIYEIRNEIVKLKKII